MLMNSSNNLSEDGPLARQNIKTLFIRALIIAILGTTLGSILGLLMGMAHRSDDLISSATIGGIFGTGLGIIVGVLLVSIRRLRELRTRSKMRTTLVVAGLAALAGALIFVPFSEGAAMALYLAVEGAIAGALVGGLLGFLVATIWPPRL